MGPAWHTEANTLADQQLSLMTGRQRGPASPMVANILLEHLLNWANHMLPEERLIRRPLAFHPESVLIIPSLFIGDNLLLTPMIRNLRLNLGSSSRIDIACPAVMNRFFETLPYLDQTHTEKRAILKHPKRFLETQAYDTVIFCRYSEAWSRAACQAKVPHRVGFDLARLGLHTLQHWGSRLTHSIPSSTLHDPRPQLDIYLDLLRHLGMSISSTHPEFRLTPDDHGWASKMLRTLPQRRLRVMIHATSGSPGKRWPKAYWRVLLNQLQQEFNPLFFTLGSASEASFYPTLGRQFDWVNLCGKSHIRQSLALLQHMDLVITLDTAIAHMAALAQVPRLIVLYGPTNPRQWQPPIQTATGTRLSQMHLSLPCQPCPARTCPQKSCMRELHPEHVLSEVRNALIDYPKRLMQPI